MSLTTTFAGRRLPLLWLAFRTGLYSVLTLGLYRFWQKTRLRRWYWSAIRPGGLPLDYVGDPFEKLLGFLIAVVILAFYIGVVNLALMFVSFSLFQGNYAAYLLSFIGVIPVWFYARYRARRYILARTRWRGLRFGLAPGAWGYAFRALLYWALTILSAGLLWPLMTFQLEKYRTNRTWFGDRRFTQGGRWLMLYRSTVWLWATLVPMVLTLIAIGMGDVVSIIVLSAATGLTCVYGLVYYRVDSLRRLTATKEFGNVTLTLNARPLRVLWITLSGNLIAGLGASIPALFMLGLFLQLQSTETLVQLGLENAPQLLRDPATWLLLALTAMSYFAIFLVWGALRHAFVTLPIWRHYAEALVIDSAEDLDHLRQRPRDKTTQAEGFAEALDVGASL